MAIAPRYIVVVGTSAGGISALSELVSIFKPGLNAAYFICMHLSRKGVGEFLVHRLRKHTQMTCKTAENGEAIQEDVIYVAPPDEHMLVDKEKVILGKGPAENRWRPSVNNLFRSAAAAYANHVLGIILTGFLDDGTAGMSGIKRSGGICIVQDPNEAEYPDMPMSVLNTMEVDYCVSVSEMGAVIELETQKERPDAPEVPQDVMIEAQIDKRVSTSIQDLKAFKQSEFNCPDCGGGLWLTTDHGPSHFRCHVGHSYTTRDLEIRQTEKIESTLWTALRMMEERKLLLENLYQKESKKGHKTASSIHQRNAEEISRHIDNLKEILFTTPPPD